MYEGVLYPRYKNQNYIGLDSSQKSKIFEAYDTEKKLCSSRKIVSVFCCLWMVFHCLQQLKRVGEKVFFLIIEGEGGYIEGEISNHNLKISLQQRRSSDGKDSSWFLRITRSSYLCHTMACTMITSSRSGEISYHNLDFIPAKGIIRWQVKGSLERNTNNPIQELLE